MTKEIWEMKCLHPQDNDHLTTVRIELEHEFLGLFQREKSTSLIETYFAMDEKSANKFLF